MFWAGLVFVAVLGVIFGSFINALEWRLRLHRAKSGIDDERSDATADVTPLRALGECMLGAVAEVWEWLRAPYVAAQGRTLQHKRKPKKADKYSIVTGRSMCPHCEHELAAKDLVPVLSWLWLRGRCRYCKAKIGWQYPLVELLTGLLFAASYLAWPQAGEGYGLVSFGIWLLMLTGFVALAVYDYKWQNLPNELLYPLLWLMVLWLGLDIAFSDGVMALTQAAIGVAIIWGMFFAIYCFGELTGRELIGYGDVRLSVLLGLLVGGPVPALATIFLASLLGTLLVVPKLLTGKADRTSQIPYGPFLLFAAVIVFLLGDRLTVALTTWLLGSPV